jgi:hypothetical protein
MIEPASPLDANDVGWLAVRIFRWLVNPSRPLPTGVALADLAGDDLREFTEHVDGTLGGFAATAERRGRRRTVDWLVRSGGTHTDLAGPRSYLRSRLGRPRSSALGTPTGVGGVGFRTGPGHAGSLPGLAGPGLALRRLGSLSRYIVHCVGGGVLVFWVTMRAARRMRELSVRSGRRWRLRVWVGARGRRVCGRLRCPTPRSGRRRRAGPKPRTGR